MKIRSAFPSKYLSASDFDSEQVMTIHAVRMERIGRDEQKPVCYFQESRRGLVLNRTNSYRLEDAFGPDTDARTGQQVTLYVDQDVQFQGRQVPGLRVRANVAPPQKRRAPAKAETAKAAQAPLGKDGKSGLDDLDDLQDEIPF